MVKIASQYGQAVDLIYELVGAEPVWAGEVIAAAKARGISKSALDRAAHNLVFTRKGVGVDKRWLWTHRYKAKNTKNI